jgi:hypothetical protein
MIVTRVSTTEAAFSVRSARRLYRATLVIFGSQFSAVFGEFQMKLVPDEK